jgi:hypothetical protein
MAFPVAIGTTNIALIDFFQNRLPGVAFAKHAADVIALFPANVIEIKTAGISFPAIDARMQ